MIPYILHVACCHYIIVLLQLTRTVSQWKYMEVPSCTWYMTETFIICCCVILVIQCKLLVMHDAYYVYCMLPIVGALYYTILLLQLTRTMSQWKYMEVPSSTWYMTDTLIICCYVIVVIQCKLLAIHDVYDVRCMLPIVGALYFYLCSAFMFSFVNSLGPNK